VKRQVTVPSRPVTCLMVSWAIFVIFSWKSRNRSHVIEVSKVEESNPRATACSL
jgi:hypothetical protein